MPAGFTYDSSTDTIECPTVNKIIATGKKDRYQRQRYKIKDASCLSCNALSQCGANFLKQKISLAMFNYLIFNPIMTPSTIT
jgi:hypothetical protein